jgi:hypothetical protein
MGFTFETAMHLAKRISNPFMAKKADDLVNETMDFGMKAGPEILGPKTGGESYHEWLRRGEEAGQGITRRIIDDFHTPEFVLGRDPAGQAIIDSGTKWDLEKNNLMSPILKRYSDITTFVGKGSTDDELVFKALENPTLAGALKPRGRALYEFLQSNYDYTAQHRITRLAGSPEKANEILRLAGRKNITNTELADFTGDQLEALEFAKRLKTNYAPHVFDRNRLIELFSSKIQKFTELRDMEKASYKKKWYDTQVAEYEASVKRLTGGDPLSWETLPKEFAFAHQKVRKGEDSYVNSARQSFESYIHNWGNAVFDNEAVKEMEVAYQQLVKTSPQLAPYAKWFIREYAGYNSKTAWDKIAGTIASTQYIRTMGLNLRSPVMNLTQGLNTAIDANPLWAAKGYMHMWTPKIKDLWEKTGLSTEIPHAFSVEANPYMTRLERAKRMTGFLFNMAETFNRKHAFSTYFTKATEKLGMEEADAIQYAIKGVHKTQFQYGRVGMPKALRTPAGKVFGQFSSFSIKQAEFLWKTLKEDPKKTLAWFGATWGGNRLAQDVLGVDLSSALGIPVNFGEMLGTMSSLSRGEFDEAIAHSKMLFEGGSGVLPSGPGGPTLGSLKDIGKAFSEGKPMDMLKSMVPVQAERLAQLMHAVKMKGETGTWNRYNKDRSEMLSESSALDTAMEFGGPKPYKNTKETNEWYKQQVFDKLATERKRNIADQIVRGNTESAEKMMSKYNLVPSPEMLQEAMMKKVLPRDLRKKWIASRIRQEGRENE